MCTVTYLPDKLGGFILTSNRDEHVLRKKAHPPRKFNIGETPVFYPKDQQAGGTWIATGLNGFTLCLLNGAFERHHRVSSYKISRGKMVLDFFKYNNVNQFYNDYDFKGIEPFTLVIVASENKRQLYQLIWDGNRAELNELNETQPRVWSSVTLYAPEIINLRREWFQQWLLQNPKPDFDSAIAFHEKGGNGNLENDLVMNRDGQLFTVSITSIKKSEEGIYMMYNDLPEKKKYFIRVI
jgi:hypothetical protein